MAKGTYIGIGGTAHKVKKMYIGIGGVARKVKKIYIGVNGVAHLTWQGTVPAGQIIFTASQIWTVPDGVKSIDVFMVGGGASGAIISFNSTQYSMAGGGSGYTKTVSNISVTPGQQISVGIGAGAARSSGHITAGGTTSFGSYSVAGGAAEATNYIIGGNGGSGGGGGSYPGAPYDGGVDGSAGKPYTYSGTVYAGNPGSGQGTTTRAFGENGNTLYAGAGGAGCYRNQGNQVQGAGGAGGGGRGFDASNWVATASALTMYSPSLCDGAPNTGGGGGGAFWYASQDNANPHETTSGAGGSGIVIVRWIEQ